ncbi:amidohydrolase [Mycoplasma sp. Pen4]|uniref:amidohydrolase n=1 Tax=Mycoplasma sp. Pen4 TaxID=640330 RepID=UPI00165403D2|nr:amidohydrolase [Mycoplasma sp. Pen4]QNM93370.1 amidohydrolase [Mycoplasma sp. Pen4]
MKSTQTKNELLILKNAIVVTMEKEEVLHNQFVYVYDGKFLAISEKKLKTFNVQVDKIIEKDIQGNLIMPGLINCHNHGAMTIFRNFADDLELESWLYTKIFPLEDKLIDSDVYIGSKLAQEEMLASGTTSYVDMYMLQENTVKAVKETGIRAFIGSGLVGDGQTARREKENKYLFNKYNNTLDGLLNIIASPHAVYTNDDESLKLAKRLHDDFGTLLTVHANESETEVRNCLEKHGKTPIQLLNDYGILTDTTILAHVVHTTDKDLEIIKATNSTIAHNPVSNLKIASGIAPIDKYVKWGINITLGTDGPASNNGLDMFETAKYASILAKNNEKDAAVLPAYQILEMLTVNGAKALHKSNELGKIKVGYIADFIVVDINNIFHSPKNNIINSLVYSTSGRDVLQTYTNGVLRYSKTWKAFGKKTQAAAEKAISALIAR